MSPLRSKGGLFLHSLDNLLKPFPYELRSTFKNSSTTNGFENYVKSWVDKLLILNLDSIQRRRLYQVKEYIEGYGSEPLRERKKKFYSAYFLILKVKEDAVFSYPVQYLKGIGPRKAERLKKLGIQTLKDFLFHFPRRYEDRSNLCLLRNLKRGEITTVRGRILAVGEEKTFKGRTITKAVIGDGTGTLLCIWFDYPQIKNFLPVGKEGIFTGRVEKSGDWQMVHPEFEVMEGKEEILNMGRIVPFYPLTQDLTQRMFRSSVMSILKEYSSYLLDPLPPSVLKENSLMPLREAIREIHFPSSWENLRRAKERFSFEEFFLFQIALKLRMGKEIKIRERSLSEGKIIEKLSSLLPFSLTQDQKRVLREVEEDMNSSGKMYRLLQGEVGSGKTVVALGATIMAVEKGWQVAILSPTSILAEQHYFNFLRFLAPLKIKVEILTGREKKNQKKEKARSIKEGKVEVIVGTHALIQEGLEFKNLGLVIIDEQHKFGVVQRAKLKEKGRNPHILVISATPIPRTLALALYGDMDISTLEELPSGERKVKTYWVSGEEREKINNFIKEELSKGRQVYYVVPRIRKGGEIKSLEEVWGRLKDTFPEVNIGYLHGRMKPEEQKRVMDDFRKGKIQILLTTTVIEVGIDVPRATLMVIENAERFGLSQLHQLRGRIGRGSHISYCLLMGNPTTEKGRKRLETLIRTESGFEVSEEDMKIRGPGELLGTLQHGFVGFKVVNLLKDRRILEKSRKVAHKFLSKHPHLEGYPHILEFVEERFPEWKRVSA